MRVLMIGVNSPLALARAVKKDRRASAWPARSRSAMRRSNFSMSTAGSRAALAIMRRIGSEGCAPAGATRCGAPPPAGTSSADAGGASAEASPIVAWGVWTDGRRIPQVVQKMKPKSSRRWITGAELLIHRLGFHAPMEALNFPQPGRRPLGSFRVIEEFLEPDI